MALSAQRSLQPPSAPRRQPSSSRPYRRCVGCAVDLHRTNPACHTAALFVLHITAVVALLHPHAPTSALAWVVHCRRSKAPSPRPTPSPSPSSAAPRLCLAHFVAFTSSLLLLAGLTGGDSSPRCRYASHFTRVCTQPSVPRGPGGHPTQLVYSTSASVKSSLLSTQPQPASMPVTSH